MKLREWCLSAAMLLALLFSPLSAEAQQSTASPAVTNGAYASGNALGGLVSFTVSTPSGATGIIQSFVTTSVGGSSPALDVILFNANPTASTCTDKTAVAVATADLTKIIAAAQITSWIALGTPTMGQATQFAQTYRLASGQTVWACVVTRAVFTPASTSDITYIISVLP